MDNTAFTILDIAAVHESESNTRQHFDGKALAELTESIKAKGIVAPLIVRKRTPGRYELVDGARRLRAAKAAGLDEIPAIVRDLTDEEALEIGVIANLQRTDVHPLDEAEGYKKMLDTKRYDVTSLAAKVGKSKAYIYSRLQLTGLVKEGRKLLLSDEITVGHAVLICRLAPDTQRTFIKNDLFEWSGGVQSVAELRKTIEREFMLDLSATSFPKKDPLLTSAGACTVCPKRTGFDAELFNDITKKDLCTDVKCFDAKVDAFIARAKKDGAVAVTTSWNTKEKGVLSASQYTDPVKGCKSKVKAVIVEGGAQRGRIIDICTNEKCDVCLGGSPRMSRSHEKAQTPASRYKRRMEIHENRIEQTYRERLYVELLKIIAGAPTRSHLLMIIAKIEDRFDGHLPDIGKMIGLKLPQSFPDTIEEWTKYLAKATDANLLQLICGTIMRQDLISDASFGHDDADRMNLLCAIHNNGQIDTKVLRASVTAELEPKKPKPPKVEPKKKPAKEKKS